MINRPNTIPTIPDLPSDDSIRALSQFEYELLCDRYRNLSWQLFGAMSCITTLTLDYTTEITATQYKALQDLYQIYSDLYHQCDEIVIRLPSIYYNTK